MGVVDILRSLAEIEAADDADVFCVCVAQDIAKEIAAWGKVGAGVVELDLSGVIGRDAAHADEEDVGAHVTELRDEAIGIESGIGLAQVGLDPADGLGHPPALVGGDQGGCGEKQGEEAIHFRKGLSAGFCVRVSGTDPGVHRRAMEMSCSTSGIIAGRSTQPTRL